VSGEGLGSVGRGRVHHAGVRVVEMIGEKSVERAALVDEIECGSSRTGAVPEVGCSILC